MVDGFGSVERERRNHGPKRRGLCRIRHAWRITSVDLAGHQSNRGRICMRKGCTAKQRQSRGYYGGPRGRWVWWPRTLWCNHGRGGGPCMAAPEEERRPWEPTDPNEDRSHIRFGPILGHCIQCGKENALP